MGKTLIIENDLGSVELVWAGLSKRPVIGKVVIKECEFFEVCNDKDDDITGCLLCHNYRGQMNQEQKEETEKPTPVKPKKRKRMGDDSANLAKFF